MRIETAKKLWLVKQLGHDGTHADLKKEYFSSQGAVGFGVTELENNWLRLRVAALGGNPNLRLDYDLWSHFLGLSGTAMNVGETVTAARIRYYKANS